MRKATLCIFVQGTPISKVILGFKKTGFGKGKYTGFGGKVEAGETILLAAQRELVEETQVFVPAENIEFVGILTFVFPNQPSWDQEVHVFKIDRWAGSPLETDEMHPESFDILEVPFDQMWDDARYWLPPILAGLRYTAKFTFQKDNQTVESVALEEVNSPSRSCFSDERFSMIPLLSSTLASRMSMLSNDPEHKSALRLFNGFLEGNPELVVDLYSDTLVLHYHGQNQVEASRLIAETKQFYTQKISWIKTILVKLRTNTQLGGNRYRNNIVLGDKPSNRIYEQNVWYAINLLQHQDDTFYLDTRNLRGWAYNNLKQKRVLNTFAYTGSLGVAASAGGANQVVHLDKNRKYLELANLSHQMNSIHKDSVEFLTGDFFPIVSSLKRKGDLFDCVILDPPFFSITTSGRVDLVSQSTRLINKVRPLIANDGWLVAVNNALYLSGADYLGSLEDLCKDGYMQVETLIPIPPDCTGYPQTRLRSLPADPTPFNHATKIVVLRVRRKGYKT